MLGFPCRQQGGTACLGHVVCTIVLLMGFEDLERIFLICGGMCAALFIKVVHQSPDNQSAVMEQHRAVVFEVRDFVNRARCYRPKALHSGTLAGKQYFICVGNNKMGLTG